MASGHGLPAQHEHVFLGERHDRNARRVWMVIALTAGMMVAEIAGGVIFGSMALMADGWHMATHAGAMLISALAYTYAKRHARDPRFTFGTGKLGDLAGFASAIVLAVVALLIGWESLGRLMNPVSISFDQAIAVALAGLAVNLASAWLLRDDHSHGHARGHAGDEHGKNEHGAHGHHHHVHAPDHNLQAAYLHVLADALTSILAIGALLLGRTYGWVWADPLMGVVGALVILRWSWTLLGATAGILLDRSDQGAALASAIRMKLDNGQDSIADLHVWQLGPGRFGAIVSLVTSDAHAPSHYRDKLGTIHQLAHVTVEVEPSTGLSTG